MRRELLKRLLKSCHKFLRREGGGYFKAGATFMSFTVIGVDVKVQLLWLCFKCAVQVALLHMAVSPAVSASSLHHG